MAKQHAPTLTVDFEDVNAIIADMGLDGLMDQVIHTLEQAIRAYTPEQFSVPARAGFAYSSPAAGLLEWMPALKAGQQVSIKVVGYHPHNPSDHALPTVLSTILVYDTHTGHLQSIMDGTFVTAVRTGAASAIASRVLARTDSKVLGLIGCGAQAVTQLHAISRLFDLKEVLIFDADSRAMQSFSNRISQLDLGLHLRSESPTEIAGKADILCTATSVPVGEGPVLQDVIVQDHLHINAIGSDFPGKTELPHSLLERALVCPDFEAQAINEGECQQLCGDQIGPDFIALVKNGPKYLDARERLTVFDSTGWALEDQVTGQILVEHARRLGLGTEIYLESAGCDPHNPYDVSASNAVTPRKFAVLD